MVVSTLYQRAEMCAMRRGGGDPGFRKERPEGWGKPLNTGNKECCDGDNRDANYFLAAPP